MDEEDIVDHIIHQVRCHTRTLGFLGADIWIRAFFIDLIVFFLYRNPQFNPILACPAFIYLSYELLKRLRLICIFLSNKCDCEYPGMGEGKTLFTLMWWTAALAIIPFVLTGPKPTYEALIAWALTYLSLSFCTCLPVCFVLTEDKPRDKVMKVG